MRIICKNCGGDHPQWDCKRPANKSTAARETRVGMSPDVTNREQVQVLRVDTNSSKAKFDKTAYQRDYVAKWRRGEVGNKYKQKGSTEGKDG